MEKEKRAKINYQTKLVPKARKVFKKKYPWKTAADTKIALLYRLGKIRQRHCHPIFVSLRVNVPFLPIRYSFRFDICFVLIFIPIRYSLRF